MNNFRKLEELYTGDDLHTARKRLFIGLIVGTSSFVCLLLVLLWIIPFVGFSNIHPYAPLAFGILFGSLILLVTWACLGLVLSILFGKSLPFSKRIRGLTIKLFLPLMTLFGRTLGISKEKIRNSFIKVNNELVLKQNLKVPANKILLLMPHCLQLSKCDMRLTYDVDNCKRCGRCPLRDLLGLRDEYGVNLAIATGGTIARRIVVQTRPALIIAVACERDLSSGIQDTYPLPVYGVLNERPHGPCLDTQVKSEALRKAIEMFILPGSIPKKNASES